jgi:hypothetical protein
VGFVDKRSIANINPLMNNARDAAVSASTKCCEMVEKSAARRQRRANDTRRWRARLHRGAAVYPVEVDGQLFDLMERFGGLKADKLGDRKAIAVALGKLLRLALAALLQEAASRR